MTTYDAANGVGNASRKSSIADPSRLAPEDAFYALSPPRRGRAPSPLGLGANGSTGRSGEARRKRNKERGRSGSRRRKGAWKKLLWVKQSCMCFPLGYFHIVSCSTSILHAMRFYIFADNTLL
jgi:hypothetical protein